MSEIEIIFSWQYFSHLKTDFSVFSQFQDIILCVFCGHYHKGGYAFVDNIHHVTLEGILEAEQDECCAVVDVFDDRLEMKGHGSATTRTLKL